MKITTTTKLAGLVQRHDDCAGALRSAQFDLESADYDLKLELVSLNYSEFLKVDFAKLNKHLRNQFKN